MLGLVLDASHAQDYFVTVKEEQVHSCMHVYHQKVENKEFSHCPYCGTRIHVTTSCTFIPKTTILVPHKFYRGETWGYKAGKIDVFRMHDKVIVTLSPDDKESKKVVQDCNGYYVYTQPRVSDDTARQLCAFAQSFGIVVPLSSVVHLEFKHYD